MGPEPGERWIERVYVGGGGPEGCFYRSPEWGSEGFAWTLLVVGVNAIGLRAVLRHPCSHNGPAPKAKKERKAAFRFYL